MPHNFKQIAGQQSVNRILLRHRLQHASLRAYVVWVLEVSAIGLQLARPIEVLFVGNVVVGG